MTTHQIENLQDYEDAIGRLVVAQLSEASDTLPHDISERLKVARMQALSKRRIVQTTAQTATGVAAAGGAIALHPGENGRRVWGWLGSLVPLAALVAGLLVISLAQDGMRASEVAEVDTELLTNDLPPEAFTDPGFNQFLRTLKQSE